MFRAGDGRSWAWTAPVLCAIHCAAAPLLVGLLPALALTSTAEWVLMGGSLVLATVVVGSAVRVHRQRWVPVVAAVGFVVWALSLADVFEPVPEVATTVLGASLVAGALLWNARLSARVRASSGCSCCDTGACDPDVAPRRRGATVQAEAAAPKR
jgi:hypothetical protein